MLAPQPPRQLSRRAIEAKIAEGETLVIFEGHVLKLDTWIDRHPGGRLAIQHMVGTDATCEMRAYHLDRTLRLMRAFRIGSAPADWANFVPPIRGGVFHKLCADDKGLDLDLKQDLGDKEKGLAVVEEQDRISTANAGAGRDVGVTEAMQVEIDRCLSVFPSPDRLTQHAIADKYTALHQIIIDGGYYTCNYSSYARECVRYALLFSTFLVLLSYRWYITAGLCLGAFWQQIMFTAHDAGHRSITTNMTIDTAIGIFIADFCCGLSFGWWKSSHNVHHLVTNSPEHDPDIQNTPLFATCPSQLKTSMHSSYYDFVFQWDKACEFVLPYQKYMYYPIMGIARFNLYLLGWCHILGPRAKSSISGAAPWTRYAEIIGMATYWFTFGYLLCWRTLPDWPTRVAFVLASHSSSALLHVQITLSHWGMPTCDIGTDESFAQKQLRTTMDIVCPIWLDWLHGGLQFQAIHHLFPRLPRHNLRKVQPLVKAFCEETGIQYTLHGFRRGNGTVITRLGEISDQLAMLVECQEHMSVTGESGLH